MVGYFARRFLYTIVMLAAVSVVGFFVIELPPGDFLTQRIEELSARGDRSAELMIEELRLRYGLDKPLYERYWIWITHFVRGDFGRSFHYERAVKELIGERIALTVLLTLASMIFTWLIAIPIGIYSATHQYSFGDQLFTFISFFGIGTPGFLLAILVMFIAVFFFDKSVGGLFSADMVYAPWGWPKIKDLLNHLWLPALIAAVNGTGGLIRIMRGNLLDILGQPFVEAARAKGLKESTVIFKHAVRIAINPLITILGMELPNLISGATLVSVVLNLPTIGPMFVDALQRQDMYLAGTFLMFLAIMLVAGNFLADLALAWADPRIRYD